MKKILFVAAAVAALSLASCGNGDKDANAQDSDTIIEVDAMQSVTPVDTLGDTVVAVVNTVVDAAEGVVPAGK